MLGDALSAHERALQFGGRDGIHDINLIESAIARPYTGYYRSIHKKAAALVESASCNHGFVDGNKRTSVILMHLLVAKSGYQLNPAGENIAQETEDMVLETVTGQMDFDERVNWFKRRLVKSQT